MKLNKKNFFSNLNKQFLFENNPFIAVAVSGGPDSMALIYLMKEWVKTKKGKVLALLIDHKLRAESYNECKHTQNYLKTLNVNSKIIRVTAKKIDDLQQVISSFKEDSLGLPLNYINMRN